MSLQRILRRLSLAVADTARGLRFSSPAEPAPGTDRISIEANLAHAACWGVSLSTLIGTTAR